MGVASLSRAATAAAFLEPLPASPGNAMATRYLWAITRLCMGWVFLWPFLDKMFGLGHETPTEKAWLNGGSPSMGFLSGSTGPFSGFIYALLLIGLALVGAGNTLGFGNWWRRTDLVRRYPWLT